MMNRKRTGVLVSSLLCGVMIVSCGGRGPARNADSTAGGWVQKRPPVRIDSIRVEGMMQRVELGLYDRDLPFSTYIPAKEIKAETIMTRDNRTARFIAGFAGKINPDAYIDIVIPNTPLELSDIKHQLLDRDGLVTRMGWKMESGRVPSGDMCPWADEYYFFVHPTPSGRASVHLCVGRHKDQAFYVIVQLPDQYADGFTPRVDLILRELRWLDDGTKLRRE